MIELVTIDVYFSTTISWTSERSSLSNSWWVEEDELHTLRNVLVIQCELKLNLSQWRGEGVWWRVASSFSGGNNLSWGLSEWSPHAEGIIGVVNIINKVKWIEVVTFECDQLFSTEWTKIWDQLLEGWVVVVPVFNVLL